MIQQTIADGQPSYVAAYIRTATKEDALDAPDREQAGDNFETLNTLYEAHRRGGKEAAGLAYEQMKRFRPALAEYDPDNPIGYKPDDDQLATALGRQIGEEAAFFHSEWKIYERGCWRRRSVHEFRRYIRRELRRYRGNGVNVNQTRIKSLAGMLEDDLHIPDDLILSKQREQVKYVNLRNGLFNLETLELEPHRPDLYFTNQLDFNYDPHAVCGQFRHYLNTSLVTSDGSTDWDLVTLTLEALGYSMTARTDLKASFWLVGQKDSGKSTLIALIKAIMGDLHATIDLTQLGLNRFLLSSIVGKRVVTFTEASSSTVLQDAHYKTLVGGSDEVYADVKNRDGFSFRPEAKIWWAMNEMPRMSDRSGATTRRIIIIPFNRTIPEDKRIADLEYKLAAERPGIFNLVMDHLRELNSRGGFTTCQQSEQLREEYILENDTEATFVEECTKRTPGHRTPAGALYARYSDWCNLNGFKPKNSNQVAKEWRRLGFEHLNSAGKWWVGVQLNGDV